jgi:GT2 family glycosyltransferase
MLVGLCSWNNPKILKTCIYSLINSINSLDIDNIAVVLNEADDESISFLKEKKINFICLQDNYGVLAIDFLKPFIEQSEYFLNTNDDMVFKKGFVEDIIEIIENNYPCTASCSLVENFYSNNQCVFTDTRLKSITDKQSIDLFYNTNYSFDSERKSYNHPICVKSADFMKVGGYSDNWSSDFLSGYGADDYFPFRLKKLNCDYKFLCSKKSFVYHESSATMKKLDQNIRNQNNSEKFLEKTSKSIYQFRQENL